MTIEKEVTIYDIARKLNLSIATVSRALNDDKVVSKKTKKRIFDLSQELGYRHNRFASSLRTKKTNTIGVIVPRLNSNFIASVLAGIEKFVTEGAFDLIIATSSEKAELEKANAINMFQKRVDGLIVSLAIDTEDLTHFTPFHQRGIPVIFFDRVAEDGDIISVVIDNYKCGFQVAEHLIKQGCRRIAMVTASLKRNVYAQRYKGYLDAHSENNLQADEKILIINDLSEQSALDAASELLKMKPMPDGLVVTNDFAAAVIMNKLKENGIRVPEDIAIVGFNNDVISKLVEPKLTTIDYPGLEMGKIIARNLINHLNGVEDIRNTSRVVVRTELIVRGSSLRKKMED